MSQTPVGRMVKKPYRAPALRPYGDLRTLTLGTGGSGNGDAGSMTMAATMTGGGGTMTMSDRRAKQDLTWLAAHPKHGFGLYAYRYKKEFRSTCGDGVHIGVMAQDVAPFFPDAVILGRDGLYRVDYSRLH
jgi:hypothetical protein